MSTTTEPRAFGAATQESPSVVTVDAWHCDEHGRVEKRREEVAVEEPYAILLEGETLAVTLRTPGHDEELSAGFLLAEGHDPKSGRAGARVVRRGTLSSAACGVCGRDDVDELVAWLRPLETEATFSASLLGNVTARLPEHQPGFARSGGLHAAALLDRAGRFLVVREDIGRHNAVDKVLGRAALDDQVPLSSHLLVVSGRVSFEIIQKAVAAGVPAVIAISAPSSLAIELAERFRVLLVGFARGGGFTTYAGAFRVEQGG